MKTLTLTAENHIIDSILSIIKDFLKNEQFFITIKDNDDIIFETSNRDELENFTLIK